MAERAMPSVRRIGHRTIDNVFRNWLDIKGEPYPPGTH